MVDVREIITKAQDDVDLTADETASLYRIPLFSHESAMIQMSARLKSRKASMQKAEIHGRLVLDHLDVDEAVILAEGFVAEGAGAVVIRASLNCPLEKLRRTVAEIRRSAGDDILLAAEPEVTDLSHVAELGRAGCNGYVCQMPRAGGVSGGFENELEAAAGAGLRVGMILPALSADDDIEWLVRNTLAARDAEPAFVSVSRAVDGTQGGISEARLAHTVGVIRLALFGDTPGVGLFEASVSGSIAGANLLYADVPTNDKSSVMSMADCRRVFAESEWQVHDGPSLMYRS
ncbi:MAG: hypothetical protein KKA42_03785 [candidate division Zixibacteria bacterium]|nr:hypothetical protein [candidate division Zixibacteria bacterium]